jgi:hypothetical protein
LHNLILVLATAAPTDSPSLKPGLDPDQVSPGFLGFLVTFGVVAVMFFVIRDMVKRIRRVRYRAQVEAQDGAQDGGEPARPGGSHGPGADYPESGSRDDGRSGAS